MGAETMRYNEILAQIRKLAPSEQVKLLAELTEILQQRSQEHKRHSILELDGLGADLWAGIDAQEYVRQEREAWER